MGKIAFESVRENVNTVLDAETEVRDLTLVVPNHAGDLITIEELIEMMVAAGLVPADLKLNCGGLITTGAG